MKSGPTASITPEIAWHYKVLPAEIQEHDLLVLYASDTADAEQLKKELELVLGTRIKLLTKDHFQLEQELISVFRKDDSSAATPKDDQSTFRSDQVGALILEARHQKASDIHIESLDGRGRIRFRIDGDLVERARLTKSEYPALVNKVKVMAGLDISEKRLPQDGRIYFNQQNQKFDIRVSVLPTLYGEKIVMRLLGAGTGMLKLEGLGFSELDLKRYSEAIKKNTGIILISGPTGSGKTTTLYATLKILNQETDNILTVEDPVEYTLDGINQVQVKDDIGLTFSEALRSFLRQDPDIIMVGEIRDTETANLAIRAALTGHLVLSTIHTNSAWGTISRLMDMGIPSFLIANTLIVSVAQRLIRLLCEHCKKEEAFDAADLPPAISKHLNVERHYRSVGCKECFFTGYKGRKAIYEVIPIDAYISESIRLKNAEVNEYFKNLGIRTLHEGAIEIWREGKTSIDEIYPYLLDDQY